MMLRQVPCQRPNFRDVHEVGGREGIVAGTGFNPSLTECFTELTGVPSCRVRLAMLKEIGCPQLDG